MGGDCAATLRPWIPRLALIAQIRAAPTGPPSCLRPRDSARTGSPCLCPQHAGLVSAFPLPPLSPALAPPGTALRALPPLAASSEVSSPSVLRVCSLYPPPFPAMRSSRTSRVSSSWPLAPSQVSCGEGWRGACSLPENPAPGHRALALSEPRCASPKRGAHPGLISASPEAREGGQRPWREAARRAPPGGEAARAARASGARVGAAHSRLLAAGPRQAGPVPPRRAPGIDCARRGDALWPRTGLPAEKRRPRKQVKTGPPGGAHGRCGCLPNLLRLCPPKELDLSEARRGATFCSAWSQRLGSSCEVRRGLGTPSPSQLPWGRGHA